MSQRLRSAGSVGGLGHLERAEDPPPDQQRVRDGLHAGRVAGELVVAEVGLPHSGRHDQVVVAELDLARRPAAAPAPGAGSTSMPVTSASDALHVAVPAEHVAQRRGDLALGQDPGRALVQQRLEQVVLARGRSG